jgi:DNA-binding response OmpR family regulator
MPGLTGLEVAQALAEDWPAAEAPFPLLVFITAHDHYALQAFEHAAMDYLLKPVEPARLARCVQRLRQTGGTPGRAVRPGAGAGAGPDPGAAARAAGAGRRAGRPVRRAGAATAGDPGRRGQRAAFVLPCGMSPGKCI